MAATSEPTTSARFPAGWRGLVDDAAVFPPGDLPLAEALAAHRRHRREWYADLVGSFVVDDRRLPAVASETAHAGTPVSVVVTGGAGGLAGPLALAARHGTPLAGVEIALRDLDDLAGAARRVVAAVDAARGDGVLPDGTAVFVELPQAPPSAGWLAAADEVAAAELRLKLRTGGPEADGFPTAETLAGWIDAALDRELPFKCTAGLHHAVACTDPATGVDHHGFLNVLVATRAALDGADPVGVLTERDPAVIAEAAARVPERTRSWFVSFGSCSVSEPLEDLVGLGLLEPGVA